MPVPVELWIPDQDWLESTEMTVGQSEWPEAADVPELHRKDKEVVRFIYSLRRHVSCRGYSSKSMLPTPPVPC